MATQILTRYGYTYLQSELDITIGNYFTSDEAAKEKTVLAAALAGPIEIKKQGQKVTSDQIIIGPFKSMKQAQKMQHLLQKQLNLLHISRYLNW